MVPGRSLADEVERRGTMVSEDADALVLTARRVLCMAAISEAVIDPDNETDGAHSLKPTQRSSGNFTDSHTAPGTAEQTRA